MGNSFHRKSATKIVVPMSLQQRKNACEEEIERVRRQLAEVAAELNKPAQERKAKADHVNAMKVLVARTESVLLLGRKGMGKSTFLFLIGEGEKPSPSFGDGTVQFQKSKSEMYMDSIGCDWTLANVFKVIAVLLCNGGIPKDMIIFTNDRIAEAVEALALARILNPMLVVMKTAVWENINEGMVVPMPRNPCWSHAGFDSKLADAFRGVSKKCTNLRITERGVLLADYMPPGVAEEKVTKELDLNQYLGNDDGSFGQGRNFIASARNVRIMEGHILVAELSRVDGHWTTRSVDLDEFVGVKDANLTAMWSVFQNVCRPAMETVWRLVDTRRDVPLKGMYDLKAYALALKAGFGVKPVTHLDDLDAVMRLRRLAGVDPFGEIMRVLGHGRQFVVESGVLSEERELVFRFLYIFSVKYRHDALSFLKSASLSEFNG